MELKDTVNLMCSDDYKERFKAEYWQLRIRIKKLSKFLDEHENSYSKRLKSPSLLYMQLAYMISYKNILEQRAIIDDIELGEMG